MALADGSVIDLPDLPPPAMSDHKTIDPAEDLEALLEACGGNMSLVARRLGVNRSTVLRRMRKAGLARPN